MNLRPGRGRSIETLTRMALEEIRKERNFFTCERIVLRTKNGVCWLVRREQSGHVYTPFESLNALFA